MKKFKVFIDGQAGTTGLKIESRLSGRSDIELLSIAPGLRKDSNERKRLLNAADIAFLCLPDDAAKEAVSLVENPDTVIIDASTAHRTHPDWAYGLPELSPKHREAVRTAKRIANPGCFATGFALLVHPLVSSGLVSPDYPVTCHSVTGYSGGGNKMIDEYKANPSYTQSPRLYALTQMHKHLPEMQKVSGLDFPPVFCPILAGFYAGMTVTVPVLPRLMAKPIGLARLHEFYTAFYQGQKLIRVMPLGAERELPGSMINAHEMDGRDDLELYIAGNDDRILLISRFDNLGKGASGAAVQSMNLVCGFDETAGLRL